jgi:hypothetical protein
MIEPVHLSADEITKYFWSLHRPNGDCRSPLIQLRRGGMVEGYSHPNEASWVPRGDGFAFLSQDGRVTSHSGSISRNQAGLLEIRMNNALDPEVLAHLLVEVKDAPGKGQGHAEFRESKGPFPAVRSGKAKVGNIEVSLSMPGPALTFLSPAISRVFFIANNPDIDASIFQAWNLHEGDIVIQYNTPVFFDSLDGFFSHKVHFHYPNIRSCWGFTDEGKPEHEYCGQMFSSLTFAILNGVPTPVEQYFKELNGQARCMAILPHFHTGLYSYPIGKLPSCGFVSVGFFRYLNWIRKLQGNPPLELNMVGFTGHYGPGRAWSGHDFEFEQRVYETWLDLRRISADGSAAS